MRFKRAIYFCSRIAVALLAAVPLGWAQETEPGFGDLIQRNPYLRSLAAQQQASATAGASRTRPEARPAPVAAAAPAAGEAGEASLLEVKELEKAGKFKEAAAILRQLVAGAPTRAKYRYCLAYVYYAASRAESDPQRKERMLAIGREEVYRALDLAADKSHADNPVWVANAEGLFERLLGGIPRPVPPVHGRVVAPFNGSGGILLGSVIGEDGKPVYRLDGKPVASFGVGVVQDAGRTRESGIVVRIQYRDANGDPFVVEYGNLSDTNGLKAGMRVEPTNIIGHVAPGAGGREATLRLEIKRNGQYWDPVKMLTGRGQRGETF